MLSGLLLGGTACLTIVELLLGWNWLRGTLYVMRNGAAENPYAAEAAEITGLCALLLLPLVLAALAGTVFWIILQDKTRAADAQSDK